MSTTSEPVLVHINQPRGHYIGQLRGYGCRLYRTVTGKCCTKESAMSKAVLQMMGNDHRARVLFIDAAGWYEPAVMMEAVKK